jgi:hypothetical protein
MARELGHAVIVGVLRQLADGHGGADDPRAGGSQHHEAAHDGSAQAQKLHGVADLAAGQGDEIGAFLIGQGMGCRQFTEFPRKILPIANLLPQVGAMNPAYSLSLIRF